MVWFAYLQGMHNFRLVLLLAVSITASYEGTLLLRDHGNTANAPPVTASVSGNGAEIETTAWQTRRRRAEARQWQLPVRPHNSVENSAARLLINESTTAGWLNTHAAWVTPAACVTTSFTRGDAQRGHDANMLFGTGRDFSGGNGANEIAGVVHPVCVPSADGKQDQLNGVSVGVDLHGRQCGPARCVPTTAASAAEGLYCAHSIPTEPDLPGPHYVAGVLPNREPSSTSDQSDDGQSTANEHSSSAVFGAHAPLGASTVCDVSWLQDIEEDNGMDGSNFVDFDNRSKSTARVASLRNPMNGFTYTRAPLLLKGTITGLRHNPVTDSQYMDAPESRPGCDRASEPFPIENALVEVWQADAFGRFDRGPPTLLAQAHLKAGTLPRDRSGYSTSSSAEDEDKGRSSLTPTEKALRATAYSRTASSYAAADASARAAARRSTPGKLHRAPGTCRGAHRTKGGGGYAFVTEVPGSFGPPQHLHVRVSAPGFVTLTTTVYIADDPFLAYLAPQNLPALRLDSRVSTLKGSSWTKDVRYEVFNTSFANGTNATSGIARNSSVDRVLKKTATIAATPPQGSAVAATTVTAAAPYTLNFNVTLIAEGPSAYSSSAEDLSGTWVDEASGGRVLMETDGRIVHMTEVPSPRVWGAATGILVGDTITHVDFRDYHLNPYAYPSKSGSNNAEATGGEFASVDNGELFSSSPAMSRFGGVLESSFGALERSQASQGASSIDGLSAATVLAGKEVSGESGSLSLSWLGGLGVWHKEVKPHKYRFLRLTVTATTRQDNTRRDTKNREGQMRETTNAAGAFVHLNEVVFYEGTAGKRDRVPLLPLRDHGTNRHSPGGSSSVSVRCSSEDAFANNECWRALDQDARSFWRSQDAGRAPASSPGAASGAAGTTAGLLHHQWLEVDFGAHTPERWVLPTALLLVCDNQNAPLYDMESTPVNGSSSTNINEHYSHGARAATLRNCPRAFVLEGSIDGEEWDVLHSRGGFGDWLDDSTYDGATLPLGIPDWSLPNEEEVVNDIGNNSSNSTTSSAYNSYKDDGMMKRRQLLGLPSLSSDNADSLSSNMVRGAALFDFGPHSHYHQGGQGEGWLGAHSGRPDGSRCGSCDVVQGAWVSGLDATTSSSGEKKSSCLYDGLDPTCASSYCGLDGLCAPRSDKKCPLGFYLNHALATEPSSRLNDDVDSSSSSVFNGSYPVDVSATMQGGSDTPRSFTSRGSEQVLVWHCEACPSGRFGNVPWLNNDTCSGPCREGYYCPPGSTHVDQHRCGGVHVFCPQGSHEPIPVSAGYYTVSASRVSIDPRELRLGEGIGRGARAPGGGGSSRTGAEVAAHVEWSETRGSQELCAPGTYCVGGVAQVCPQGTYGAKSGLDSPACTGRCFAGTYCPPGTAHYPIPCPVGYYCPDGMQRWPCPAGNAGNSTGLVSAFCSGRCPPGSYCPPGTAVPLQCPGGTYGDISGLPSSRCSGPCPEGFYCPQGTILPRQLPCGGAHVYCPLGSAFSQPVDPGAYSLGGRDATQQPRQQVCEPGYFCAGGLRYACRNGTYGARPGLAADPTSLGLGGYSSSGSTAFTGGSAGFATRGEGEEGSAGPAFWCDGFCARGHWCPEASISPHQVPCPAGTYGAREGLGTTHCSGLCAPGHYCPPGSISATEVQCPAGQFGNASGLTSAACSHACASAAHTQGSYSSLNDRVTGNPYSAARDGLRALSAFPDRDPVYSGSSGTDGMQLAESSNWCQASVCAAGYYCPNGSITAKQRECGGPHLYCPEGSGKPLAVPRGFYSTGGADSLGGSGHGATRTNVVRCEPGSFCQGGVRRKCPAGRFGASSGLASPACDGKCAAGHYCPAGSTSPLQVQCPAGRYGAPSADSQANNSAYMATNNEDDNYGSGSTSSTSTSSGGAPGLKSLACSGRCAAGYWCPPGSTSPYQNKCGSDRVYCPTGSGQPVPAKPGFFTIGGANATVRTAQRPCEPGSFCQGGVKFDCPPGTFGSATAPISKRTIASCSGLCAKGHWCPAGSTSPTAMACPFGRYGATTGLGTSKCSGVCLRAYECREGSVDQHGSRVVGGAS